MTTTPMDRPRAERPGLPAQIWRWIVGALSAIRGQWRRFAGALGHAMPKGLYARSLIIIIAPIIILEAVIAYVFIERHWQTVTARLSEGLVRDIAAVVELVNAYPEPANIAQTLRLARERLDLITELLPGHAMPPPAPRPFIDLLGQTLNREMTRQIGLPFWVDPIGRSGLMEVRVQLEEQTLRVRIGRSRAYAANSEIFLLWMIVSSLVIVTTAVLFLRNQVRPIVRLAGVAERFGRGQASPSFQPSGAREVREAALAFIEMRRRIERQIEQRTTMLAGVSHDLRTVLTRFRLQLAFLEGPDADELKRDVDEMQAMLEGYIAFAKGDASEESADVDMPGLLVGVAEEARKGGAVVDVQYTGEPVAQLRPQGMRRLVTNLVSNAARHGTRVDVVGERRPGWLTLTVDDDGPGIPPEHHEDVFRPFVRLDEARNLDESGTGLGLAIALDIASVHGGAIALGTSPLGGLRVTVRLPA